jgi:membrane protein DedA with SNARE-associated domain/rhodanese-related sulfurtransferase
MKETSQFLVDYGAPILFAAVFLEQMGLPLPAMPWLLAAGALCAGGKFSPVLGIGLTVLACVVADIFWFYLGRYRGNQVLRFLCRVSLEPDSCVRRTQNLFTRYGMKGIVGAKFLPGFSTIAPPLAGMSGVNAGRFLLVDAFASLLYGACFIGVGFIFRNQIGQIASAIQQLGGSALGLVVGVVAAYFAFKFWRRRSLLRELRMTRITVDELREKQTAGESLVILDLRSRLELEQDPAVIQGALHFAMDDVEQRHQEIPRDREVIVYCACPNEVSSARVALQLRRKGITHVRPLLGGIDAWREVNYPLDTFKAAAAGRIV